MAWSSTLKYNRKADDLTVHYASWIGFIKSTPEWLAWFNNQSLLLYGDHA